MPHSDTTNRRVRLCESYRSYKLRENNGMTSRGRPTGVEGKRGESVHLPQRGATRCAPAHLLHDKVWPMRLHLVAYLRVEVSHRRLWASSQRIGYPVHTSRENLFLKTNFFLFLKPGFNPARNPWVIKIPSRLNACNPIPNLPIGIFAASLHNSKRSIGNQLTLDLLYHFRVIPMQHKINDILCMSQLYHSCRYAVSHCQYRSSKGAAGRTISSI